MRDKCLKRNSHLNHLWPLNKLLPCRNLVTNLERSVFVGKSQTSDFLHYRYAQQDLSLIVSVFFYFFNISHSI